MIIRAINATLPSRKICNDEIIELVLYNSRRFYKGNLSHLSTKLQYYFDKTKIKTRYWRAPNEKPYSMINTSYQKSLAQSNINPSDIDILIYVSVDRGFIEPANSSFIAKNIGIPKVRSFDIVDACMGWCTALQVCQSMIKSGEIETALIISSECPMEDKGVLFPKNFQINNIEELNWKFPSYTIGEAVTSTIVTKSNDDWKFEFLSDSNNADLCTIPLSKFLDYSKETKRIHPSLEMTFSAYSKELFLYGYKNALKVLQRLLDSIEENNLIVLPHSVSMQVPIRAKNTITKDIEFYSTFSHIGNVATSSLPSHIYFGLNKGVVKKKSKVIGWVASGGLKYSAFEIYL